MSDLPSLFGGERTQYVHSRPGESMGEYTRPTRQADYLLVDSEVG
jgi:hypothetical protein